MSRGPGGIVEEFAFLGASAAECLDASGPSWDTQSDSDPWEAEGSTEQLVPILVFQLVVYDARVGGTGWMDRGVFEAPAKSSD